MFAKKYRTFATLLMLLICGFESSSAKKSTFEFSQEKDSINLSVRSLSISEMRQVFNCYNPIKIVRLTSLYHGLEVIIENKTAQDLVLAYENISLPVENTLEIKYHAKTNPVMLPVLALLGATSLLAFGAGFAIVPSVVVGATIGVTALNLNTEGSNKVTIENMRNSVLNRTHPTLIPSFSKVQKIVFIKEKDIKDHFSLGLETLDESQKNVFKIKAKMKKDS
jgi:hypothetical protein